MCIDFMDLNKATRHQLFSFMDVFYGYNQIKLDEADQEKTSFVTFLLQSDAVRS